MDGHCQYPQRSGRPWLWSVGAVFAMGVFRSAASFRELQRPEFALRHFIRFLLAKVAVGSSLELINGIYKICGGVVSTVMGGIGSAISTTATLPDKIVEAIEDVSFLESIPLWLVSLLGSLLITILSYVLILTVYGRFFKIFIYTAIAPLPLASFAGEATSRTGQTFLKSYVGVCMEGAVIVLSCVIYSAFYLAAVRRWMNHCPPSRWSGSTSGSLCSICWC